MRNYANLLESIDDAIIAVTPDPDIIPEELPYFSLILQPLNKEKIRATAE